MTEPTVYLTNRPQARCTFSKDFAGKIFEVHRVYYNRHGYLVADFSIPKPKDDRGWIDYHLHSGMNVDHLELV